MCRIAYSGRHIHTSAEIMTNYLWGCAETENIIHTHTRTNNNLYYYILKYTMYLYKAFHIKDFHGDMTRVQHFFLSHYVTQVHMN